MTDAASTLVLIRHGQSRSNAELWISSQATCGGLTDLGRSEAAAARDRLATMPGLAPNRVLVSTMRRAIETADIVAAPTGLVPEQRAELMERQPGEIEGTTVDDYIDRFGERPWLRWEPALSAGGEDALTFQTRVGNAIDRVADETVGSTTWVVCHGWFMRGVAHHYAGGDPVAVPTFGGIANAGLCIWTREPDSDEWLLSRYNDCAHTDPLAEGTGSYL